MISSELRLIDVSPNIRPKSGADCRNQHDDHSMGPEREQNSVNLELFFWVYGRLPNKPAVSVKLTAP